MNIKEHLAFVNSAEVLNLINITPGVRIKRNIGLESTPEINTKNTYFKKNNQECVDPVELKSKEDVSKIISQQNSPDIIKQKYYLKRSSTKYKTKKKENSLPSIM